jgi:hypothetical protein
MGNDVMRSPRPPADRQLSTDEIRNREPLVATQRPRHDWHQHLGHQSGELTRCSLTATLTATRVHRYGRVWTLAESERSDRRVCGRQRTAMDA